MKNNPLSFSFNGYSCLVSGSHAENYWDAMRSLDTTMMYLAIDCNVGQFGYRRKMQSNSMQRIDDNYLRC